MAITNYLVHFKTSDTFNANKDQFRNDAVAFVGDATIIHTHGTDYYCGSSPVALKSDLSGKTINNATVLTNQNLNDYNTIDKCGYYYGAGSNSVTGKPSGVDNFTLQVLRSGAGVVSQFLISGINSKVYARYCNGSGGSWTTWAELATTSALTSGLAGKANTSHTHSISNITNLQSILDGKAASSHTHTIAQISGLQTELNSKLESVSLSDLGVTATAAELNKLDGLTATTAELNYVDGVTSNIQTQLNNKAASSHNHSAANITSGTFDIARLPSITDAKITSVSASKITGTIPQANLPSYVDDVLEYSSKSSFPQTGETGKIYVDTTTNLTYRWGGSAYVEISPSLALGETSSTAYRGDRGKTAYDHSQATGNPHNLTLANLGINTTAAELNYVDGVTSNIQTQLNGKQASITGGASTITSSNLTASRALVSNSSGKVTVSTVTSTELGYLDGVTSNIQTQLNNKASTSSLSNYLPLSGGVITGNLTLSNGNILFEPDGTILSSDGGNLTWNGTDVSLEGHTHSASDITSGTLAIARIPTGTTSSTVALGNHVHLGYASTVHTHSAATTSTAGFMSAADKTKLDGITANADSVSVSRNLTSGTQIASITINGTATALYAPTNTDTKNTTGSMNSSSKLFLIGALGQTESSITYSYGSVYTQSGQLYATQMNATYGFYETSDARLKDFKEDIKALDTVDQIPTKYFTWKDDENQESQIGTSAQEVQKIYPELVSKTEDDILTVDYAKLSIIALAAIKELKAEIQSLKEEIKQLKLK